MGVFDNFIDALSTSLSAPLDERYGRPLSLCQIYPSQIESKKKGPVFIYVIEGVIDKDKMDHHQRLKKVDGSKTMVIGFQEDPYWAQLVTKDHEEATFIAPIISASAGLPISPIDVLLAIADRCLAQIEAFQQTSHANLAIYISGPKHTSFRTISMAAVIHYLMNQERELNFEDIFLEFSSIVLGIGKNEIKKIMPKGASILIQTLSRIDSGSRSTNALKSISSFTFQGPLTQWIDASPIELGDPTKLNHRNMIGGSFVPLIEVYEWKGCQLGESSARIIETSAQEKIALVFETSSNLLHTLACEILELPPGDRASYQLDYSTYEPSRYRCRVNLESPMALDTESKRPFYGLMLRIKDVAPALQSIKQREDVIGLLKLRQEGSWNEMDIDHGLISMRAIIRDHLFRNKPKTHHIWIPQLPSTMMGQENDKPVMKIMYGDMECALGVIPNCDGFLQVEGDSHPCRQYRWPTTIQWESASMRSMAATSSTDTCDTIDRLLSCIPTPSERSLDAITDIVVDEDEASDRILKHMMLSLDNLP